MTKPVAALRIRRRISPFPGIVIKGHIRGYLTNDQIRWLADAFKHSMKAVKLRSGT